jgi:hypothetical protein
MHEPPAYSLGGSSSTLGFTGNCGLRRRASTDRRHAQLGDGKGITLIPFGPAASPADKGGRRLMVTAYLAPGRSSHYRVFGSSPSGLITGSLLKSTPMVGAQ